MHIYNVDSYPMINNLMPLVSIVTPSYNQGNFIEQTLLSVKGQDYQNIEHIIVDGGSNDQTLDILTGYKDQYALRWISEKDRGQSDALNKGFRLAQGSIIGWLNSDDTYLQGAVSSAVEFISANNEINWVHGKGYWIDEQGTVVGEYPVKAYNLEDLLIFGMHMVQPSIFFKRSVLDLTGGLDVSIHSTMDFDFMLRVSRYFRGTFIPKFIATRRIHKDAKSIAQANIFFRDYIRSLDKLFSDSDLPPKIVHLKKRAYHHAYLVGGYQAFQDQDYKSARSLLKEALRYDPRPLSKDNIASIFLILESMIGAHWISPGISRKIEKSRFQSQHGRINVNWRSR